MSSTAVFFIAALLMLGVVILSVFALGKSVNATTPLTTLMVTSLGSGPGTTTPSTSTAAPDPATATIAIDCQATQSKYGIVPGSSWGSLSDPAIKTAWSNQNCDAIATAAPAPSSAAGTLDCKAIKAQYNIVPGDSWGSLTDPSIKSAWTQQGCDGQLMTVVTLPPQLTPDQYGMLPGGPEVQKWTDVNVEGPFSLSASGYQYPFVDPNIDSAILLGPEELPLSWMGPGQSVLSMADTAPGTMYRLTSKDPSQSGEIRVAFLSKDIVPNQNLGPPRTVAQKQRIIGVFNCLRTSLQAKKLDPVAQAFMGSQQYLQAECPGGMTDFSDVTCRDMIYGFSTDPAFNTELPRFYSGFLPTELRSHWLKGGSENIPGGCDTVLSTYRSLN